MKKIKKVNDIDWETWIPKERATLLFIIIGREILLIHKKRGLGAGKINGPGGRIEPNEKPIEAAIREVKEELRVEPTGVALAGELFFQFLDGFSIHGTIYRADGMLGVPSETDEAIPFWFNIDSLPYDRMWEDDRFWMPLLIDKKHFKGYFIFEGEKLIDYEVKETSA